MEIEKGYSKEECFCYSELFFEQCLEHNKVSIAICLIEPVVHSGNKQINRKTSCVHGLGDLILLRYQYYWKQSTNSMQSIPIKIPIDDISCRFRKTHPKTHTSITRDPIKPKQSSKRRKLEDSYFLFSELNTKLQWSKLCGTYMSIMSQ